MRPSRTKIPDHIVDCVHECPGSQFRKLIEKAKSMIRCMDKSADECTTKVEQLVFIETAPKNTRNHELMKKLFGSLILTEQENLGN